MGKAFFICDTETTGFSPKNADAIEVAILKVQHDGSRFNVLDALDIYINPGYPLPAAIVEFNEKNHTGINDALLARSPSPNEAAQQIANFFGDNPVVVGHNFEKFDTKFVNKLYQEQLGKPFICKKILDTLLLARKYEPAEPSHKLGAMFEKTDKTYSSEQPKFHTAIADCYATLDVLDYLVKNYGPHIMPHKTPSIER